MEPFCYYVGFLLNIFPVLISKKCSKTKRKTIKNNSKEKNSKAIEYIYSTKYEYLSTKDIIKLFVVSFFLIITDLIEIIIDIIINYKKSKTNESRFEYVDDFLLFEFLVIISLPLCFTDITYYKHQKIAFIILSLIEFIKFFYFNFFYNEFSFTNARIIIKLYRIDMSLIKSKTFMILTNFLSLYSSILLIFLIKIKFGEINLIFFL